MIYYIDTEQLNRMCAAQQVKIRHLTEENARKTAELVDCYEKIRRLQANCRQYLLEKEAAITEVLRLKQEKAA